MTPDTTINGIKDEMQELKIQRLGATGQKLQEIENKIAELLKRKVGARGRLEAMHAKMHEAGDRASKQVIQGINND